MIKFIGDIGINHGGDFEKALKLIDAFNFLDVFKMQKTHPKAWMTKEKYNSPHPDPKNAFGETYGKHRENLELCYSDYETLKKICEEGGKDFSSSCFDIPSAIDLINLKVKYIKIPSCHCNNFQLIDFVFKHYSGQVHISTGMTTEIEIKQLKERYKNFENRSIYYSCTSNYSDSGPVFLTGEPGFSCHSINLLFAKAAILSGCKFIEYHITFDRYAKGSDHKISLLPHEYREIVNWYKYNFETINRIERTRSNIIPENEMSARSKLWSIG